MQPVSPGRIVLFGRGDDARPAIVLRAWSATCATLKVFHEDGDRVVRSVEMFTGAPEDDARAGWSWPPRV